MKLIKVTGSITVEAYGVENARATVENWAAPGTEVEVTVEEIGEAPMWLSWRVTPAQAEAIEALLSLGKAPTEAEVVEEVVSV